MDSVEHRAFTDHSVSLPQKSARLTGSDSLWAKATILFILNEQWPTTAFFQAKVFRHLQVRQTPNESAERFALKADYSVR